MAKKKYYAWITPIGTGICQTWDECKAACTGYKNVKYKGFSSYEEAWQFIHPDIPCASDNIGVPDELTSSKVNTETFIEDVENTSSELSVPISSHDVPISEEVNAYCMRYNFSKLSERQKMAVQSIEGKTLLFAVPGSGKTTVIIARTGYMVYSKNINPRSIISLTFTKAAADEMITRYKAHFNTEIAPDFRTIHSLCYSVILPKLRRAGYNVPSNLLGVNQDSEDEDTPCTIAFVYRKLFKSVLQRQPVDFDTTMEAVQCIITGIKNSMMPQSRYEEKCIKIDGIKYSIFSLYNTYQQILSELDCMDFDDLLICAYEGLKKHSAVLQSIRNTYTYWNIDEAQDTSKLQFKLLDFLYGENGNVFMVGDDDQSIYSFRGANPQLLLKFARSTKVKTFLLKYNYRSSREIVSTAKAFIESNYYRAPKEMQAFSAESGYIHIPRVFRAEIGQYDYIVRAAQEANAKKETLAVLYRRNISCLPLIVYLHRHNIPYESNKGIAELLRSKKVKDIWRIFCFLDSPYSLKAFTACHKLLYLYPTREELETLKEVHKSNKTTPILELLLQIYRKSDDPEKASDLIDLIACMKRIQNLKPSAAAVEVLYELQKWTPETINDRLRIYSFLSVCDLFSSITELIYVLQDIMSEEKKRNEEIDPTDFDNSLAAVATTEKPVVTLSSMHSSKGREFSRVIIIDTFDEIMPGEEREDTLIYDHEEERRLFYVAVTRAAKRLDLLTVDKYHGNTERVSRFINEFAYLCDQYCDHASIFDGIPESQEFSSETYDIEPVKFYAVRKGRIPGIYSTWAECQSQIFEFSGADYKCFSTRNEAEEYLGFKEVLPQNQISLHTIEPYIVSSEGGAFNYPLDIPPVVNDAIHSRFGCNSIELIEPSALSRLIENSNHMYTSGKIVNYKENVEAYILTYLPVNYYKVWKPLYDLVKAGNAYISNRILELGVGPGTTTLGLISFYSELAISNPELHFELDISAVEKERNFQPYFDDLTKKLVKSCPSNLTVSISLFTGDALEFLPAYNKKYDLIIESNMLNQAEGMGDHAIEAFAQLLSQTLDNKGSIILIEPGTYDDRTFLKQIEALIIRDRIAVPFISPKILAVNLENVSLYHEAVAAHLRSKPKAEHWFSYIVMKRGNQ